MASPDGVEVHGPAREQYRAILSDDALGLVAELQRELGPTRATLLANRAERQAGFDAGELPDFLAATASVREGDWRVAPVGGELADRRVEITGPTERKMLINALNSGAKVFLADFEDANTPTFQNMFGGQQNLVDAIEGTISFQSPEGREYRLGDQVALLMPRPRGWHLPEKHIVVDGQPASGSLVDFGLFMFHGARRLLERGKGVYLYLPKLESHLEARLWNDAFQLAQDRLGIPRGTVKATVLIETITAAFEMDEILYELRDHSAGLNAGRWDYMFSIIKKFRNRPEFVLPDRNKVTMTVPFMRAYTQLLVRTCHRRGAFAMGGMSAFIPSRQRPEINEQAIAKVREDKQREAGDGFDGTWVAHPDLVPVAMEVFDTVLGDRPNQIDRQRDDVKVGQRELLDIASTPGEVTEEGLRNDVNVGIQYISSWLRGQGAAPIFNLMEDAATAEIARSQVWQWVHNSVKLQEGRTVTAELVRQTATEELEKIREQVGDEFFRTKGRPEDSRAIFEQAALADEFIEFLTIPAYEYLD
ncbi:MAG TPA: malate synthase A [Actinomycetes bacterium]|nr:malate synthase A [Actinomycetes bacterium]